MLPLKSISSFIQQQEMNVQFEKYILVLSKQPASLIPLDFEIPMMALLTRLFLLAYLLKTLNLRILNQSVAVDEWMNQLQIVSNQLIR